MAARMENLRQRVEALTVQQRILLSHRLKELNSTATLSTADHHHQQLIAYIVATEGQLDDMALRQYLQDMLPNFMIPSKFIQIESLPRMPNGKTDFQSLADLDVLCSDEAIPVAIPRNPREKILMDIWIEVLGLEEISIYDNFFEMGGDSISSIYIISRVREAGYSLMPNHLFTYPTIAELSDFLRPSSQTIKSSESSVEVARATTTSDTIGITTSNMSDTDLSPDELDCFINQITEET